MIQDPLKSQYTQDAKASLGRAVIQLVAFGKGDPNLSLEGPGFQHIITARNNPPPPPPPHVPPRTNTSLQPDPAKEAVLDEIDSTQTFSAIQGAADGKDMDGCAGYLATGLPAAYAGTWSGDDSNCGANKQGRGKHGQVIGGSWCPRLQIRVLRRNRIDTRRRIAKYGNSMLRNEFFSPRRS